MELHVKTGPWILALTLAVAGCGLFETREPEPPSQSNCFSEPATRPGVVIVNLVNAVAQKCVDNYAACFSNAADGSQAFMFVPSAEARDQYGSVLLNWTAADEQAYFRNLVAKSVTNGFSGLTLTPRDSIITPDSVLYTYDYSFTFEHTEPGFPMVARGNLRFTLAPNASNVWSIFRWVDLKTTGDITWSLFKGKFSS